MSRTLEGLASAGYLWMSVGYCADARGRISEDVVISRWRSTHQAVRLGPSDLIVSFSGSYHTTIPWEDDAENFAITVVI
jgi:hypothetical protein